MSDVGAFATRERAHEERERDEAVRRAERVDAGVRALESAKRAMRDEGDTFGPRVAGEIAEWLDDRARAERARKRVPLGSRMIDHMELAYRITCSRCRQVRSYAATADPAEVEQHVAEDGWRFEWHQIRQSSDGEVVPGHYTIVCAVCANGTAEQ